MVISVIITTKNEEGNISRCLESIKKQNYKQENIEIIVVDNDSCDNTKNIAVKYTDKIYNFGPERSAQRNFGIKQAQGKFVLYLDADMSLSPDVLGECVEKCEKDNLIALYIPEVIIGDSYWVKVRNFERSFYDATCIDAVRFVRKDKILEIKGFDESLTGPEDWDFDRRIKALGNTALIKNHLYHNEGDFSFKRYFQKKKYYSKNFQKYINKWGSNDKLVKQQLGFWYRFFGVFFEQGKIFRLLRHPILSVMMYFLRFIVGFAYIFAK